MIILAHVGPPTLLFQFRNFDVPLMVLVSGMSFGLSYKGQEAYSSYVWKRIKRLVFPVWIFLTIYFVGFAVFYPIHSDLNQTTMLESYALVGGIGYVWIIKVFLLVALISPYLFLWNTGVRTNKQYLLFVATSFLLYELARYFSLPYIDQGIGKVVSEIAFYIVPYSIIFSLGLRMLKMDTRQVLTTALLSSLVLLVGGVGLYVYTGHIVYTQELKYPPSVYYFSYAVMISCLLWYFSNSLSLMLEKMKLKQFVLYIANNSIWIYLWHIPLVKMVHINFVAKYFVVFAVAILVTYIQTSIVNSLIVPRVNHIGTKKNIKMMLTG